jgi:ketosteroid isomerase-like protein
MAVTTARSLDLRAYKEAYEEWDIETLLDLYAEDVELIQIDRDHPSSSPHARRGREVLRGMFEHCAAAGVKATIENGVAANGRAAVTVTCEFPDGRRVVANSMLELEDGRIVREREILAGDPK